MKRNEFIELFNFGTDAVDLADWVVADARKRFTITDDDFFETEINPGEYFSLWREVTGIALNNSGEESVNLYTPAEEFVSGIQFSARTRVGEAYAEATPEVYQWTLLPTPGEKNEIVLKQSGSSEKADTADEKEQILESVRGVRTELSAVRDLELGSMVSTRGIVSVPLGVLEEGVLYLSGSGIRVSLSSLPDMEFALGDVLALTGELSSYHNELQIKVSDLGGLELVETGMEISPLLVSTREVGEELEGGLVQITGQVSRSQGSTFFVDDGTGEARVLIRESTGIVKPDMRKGDEVSIVGVVSQFNQYYRILPRFQSDIIVSQVLAENPLPRTGPNFWLILAIFQGIILISLLIFGLVEGKLFARE